MNRVLAASLLVVGLAACGSDTGDATVTGSKVPKPASSAASTSSSTAAPSPSADDPDPDVRRVPDEYPTIQAAIDAAAPGDLVLISPGTYHEAVNVTTDELTIRGLDRAGVVLDGEFSLDNGIRVLAAKGVAIENMTAMNYTKNGFFWTGVEGYRGSYLTAYRTGDYGIYAFDSTKGLIEHIYAAGSPDAGVYIGECYECDAVVDDVLSEHNGLGYSGTNSGGNLLIVNSVFRFNRAGIVPNSGSYELCYPERRTTIVGNLVYSNNQPDTPAIDVAILAMGNGILSAGGVGNVIERNRVFDHDRTGIGLVPFLEDAPSDNPPGRDEWDRPCAETKQDPPPDPADITAPALWNSEDNEVRDNVVSDSGEADLAVDSVDTDLSTLGNCFGGNTFATTAPLDLERLAPCDGQGAGDWTAGVLNVARWLGEVGSRPKAVPFDQANLPPIPSLPNMPDADTAPADPATNVPPQVDLASIQVPPAP